MSEDFMNEWLKTLRSLVINRALFQLIKVHA